MKTLRSETRTYYQVLIDQRDFPYIVSLYNIKVWCSIYLNYVQKMQPEAVTFLADRKDASLYSIPGEYIQDGVMWLDQR